MAGIYKTNIKAFDKMYPYVGNMLKETGNQENSDFCFCMDGILYFENRGKKYRITSCNQEKEAQLLLRNIIFERDNLIIIFGIGNIVLLEELLKRISDDTRVAVFEPNLQVFDYIIRNYNLVKIINSGKIAFFTGALKNIGKTMTHFFDLWINLVLNIQVITLPNYYIYAQYRLDCVGKVTKILRQQLVNLGNSLEDTMRGIDNQYINVDNCILSNSINEIRDKYKGYPAIIVSSGPSLDKNISQLKEASQKAFIISCDASYRSCIANNVRPDIITSIERGIATYQYYYEDQEFPSDLVLAGPSVLRPEIFASIPGKKIIMAKSRMGVEGWWMKQFDAISFCDMGHSCATVAFSVAHAAGCSPIILIGQDLAFTGGKIHGDMAHTKYEGENKRDESSEVLWTKDINGEPICTTETYNTFRFYFEHKITVNGVKLIDATEGGAYIEGSIIMTLREAMAKYCTKKLPYRVTDLLENKRIDSRYKLEKYRQIYQAVKSYIEELEQVQAKSREFHKRIIHYRDYNFNSASEGELVHILEAMTENNQMISYLYNEHADLLTYYMQNIRQTIINVKNLGNKITGKNVYRNWVLQINLIEMIDLASSVVINEFKKIGEYILNKAEEEKGNV